jgi:hypothetical protein
MRIGKSLGTRARIRTARVEEDSAETRILDHLLGPLHRRSLESIRGEDSSCDIERTVVDDECDIRLA